jgi:hypothetical protein
MAAFHGAGHRPIAADARGGIEDAVTAHAAVDGVEGGHELLAAGGVAGVEKSEKRTGRLLEI